MPNDPQNPQHERRVPLTMPMQVHQTDFSPGKGNALQAAVASIFGLDLSDVPNFIEDPRGYEAAIRAFCEDGGSTCIKIKLLGESADDDLLSKYDGKLSILRGKSPRGDFGHVVVAKRVASEFQLLHDPHPDKSFLDSSVEKPSWCMVFDKKG